MTSPIRFHVRPAFRGASLVLAFEGFSDAGEAATTALRYVSDAFQAVAVADIDPEEFYDFTVRRPTVVLDEKDGRRIVWPANEFRYAAIDDGRELVIGVGIEPHLRWRAYCDALLEIVRELAISRVVMLGAYLADVVYSRPVSVTGFATDPADLGGLGLDTSRYEGPTGIVGVLADRLRVEGIRTVSLWAGLPNYINASPNPRGALALLGALTRLLDFRVDDRPLTREALEFEQRISRLVADDPELSEYVRQLKRRDFAR